MTAESHLLRDERFRGGERRGLPGHLPVRDRAEMISGLKREQEADRVRLMTLRRDARAIEARMVERGGRILILEAPDA